MSRCNAQPERELGSERRGYGRSRRAQARPPGAIRLEPVESDAAVNITGFEVVPFETTVDPISLGQLLTDRPIVQTVTKVLADKGAEEYYIGGHFHGDQDSLSLGSAC
jgi:hypothetical protein